MSEELKPCPFCNCEVELALHYFHQSIPGARHPSFLSSGCALRGQVFTIAEWNTRADESELAALREENERLRNANPWRYPSRGELPDSERQVEGSVISKTSTFDLYWDGETWTASEMGSVLNVYAWRELPEPAPELEDK